MKCFSSIMIFFLFISSANAQKILSLDDALSIALNESYSIKSAQYNLISSERNLEAIQLGLRTSVDLTIDAPNYQRSLVRQFNPITETEQFYQIGNTRVQTNLSINQPIVFTNGRFSVIGSLFGRDQFSETRAKIRDYYSNLYLQLNQPLFAFNMQKANLYRAELNLQKTRKNYSKAEADIIYNVTSSFYELFQTKKNLEITEEKVNQTKLSYETAMNKFRAGLIAEVEALQLEVDLATARNEQLNAQRRYEESKNNFKLLIGLPLDETLEISAELDYNPVDIQTDEAVEFALTNRPELFNSQVDIRLNEMQVEQIESEKRIKAELNVNYGINKVDEKFNNIFNDFLENRSVVFTLLVPIWDWGKNSRNVESAEANLKLSKLSYDNQRKQIINEINQIVNKINSARSRVEVLSRSIEVAEKSFNISLDRFRSGNITSFDLSQMQLRLTDAKVNSLNALIDYKLALADLFRRTLHDFTK